MYNNNIYNNIYNNMHIIIYIIHTECIINHISSQEYILEVILRQNLRQILIWKCQDYNNFLNYKLILNAYK